MPKPLGMRDWGSYFKCSSLEMLLCSVTSRWDCLRCEIDIHIVVHLLVSKAEMYLPNIDWVGHEHSCSYVQYSASSSTYGREEQGFLMRLTTL